MDKKLREKAGISILVISSLLAVLFCFKLCLIYFAYSEDNDMVSNNETRLESLKSDINPKTIYGYISDDEESPFLNTQNRAKYFMAQYALSPAIIASSSDYKFVIGNFYNRPVILNNKYKVLKDYGNGILLLKNTFK